MHQGAPRADRTWDLVCPFWRPWLLETRNGLPRCFFSIDRQPADDRAAMSPRLRSDDGDDMAPLQSATGTDLVSLSHRPGLRHPNPIGVPSSSSDVASLKQYRLEMVAGFSTAVPQKGHEPIVTYWELIECRPAGRFP